MFAAVNRMCGRRSTALLWWMIVLHAAQWTHPVHSTSPTASSSSSSSVKYTEAYFDGTNYIRLGDAMPVWGHSAISFRTCKGGEILSQSLNQHQFVTSVEAEFVRIVYRVNNTIKLEARIPMYLLDNQWHTIEFQFQLGNLNLIVDKHSTILANATHNAALLSDQDIRSNAAILILGKNYAGCLFHGPGFNFATLDDNTDQSVMFGPCPMASGNCSHVLETPLRQPPVDHCLTDPCMQHGSCTSRVNGYECHCTARYTGKNCEVDNGPPCLLKPCQNDGLCDEDVRGNYRCLCGPTYAGVHCETEITLLPHCADQCLNNATCRLVPGAAASAVDGGSAAGVDMECVCAAGFDGRHCEIDLNECAAEPCLNGGQCIDGVDSFRCDCTGTGYVGHVCDVNVDECQSGGVCLHGGKCYDTYGSYTCICPPGYGGVRCEEPLNECASQPCGPGGSCVDLRNGRFECICPNGYADATSTRCDSPNDCGGECQNGGTCEPATTAGTTARCVCAAGFEGSHCERVEPCSSATCVKPYACLGGKCVCPDGVDCAAMPCPIAPCENGGTCVTQRDGTHAQCQCPAGFNGTSCERNVHECSPSLTDANRCHFGVCVNQTGTFKCYCTPGYTGLFCDADVNECLTKPCQNGATCLNQVNNYQCVCAPGWEGKDCENDIDECFSNPCTHGATCVNGVANYTCKCVPGMTGRNCEIDIDDCLPVPCQHGGHCTDLLNGFQCNCSGTGFSGEHCEVNIDECQSQPCVNNAKCVDEVNDFSCDCVPGYRGKMCQIDIDECESSPCQYNGTCYQHSNQSLYELEDRSKLPDIFSKPFSYETASGYECQCIDGIIGSNCEINMDECLSSPCIRGVCVDGINKFTCNCPHGYEGVLCDIEINECERFSPCQNGLCIDRVGSYVCKCDADYGGVNCSVLLTGCRDGPCLNNGTCSPWLENEVTHRFNCSCHDGYQGDQCEKNTTMSLTKESLLTVNTSRTEGYDINLRFRTTLPNGRLVFGSNVVAGSYILELVHGRLNLHSSLLNKWEGVFIGASLNDSRWHKVFVAINVTHLLLSANEETTIYPINTYDNSNNTAYTTFPVTYLGGTIPHLSSYLRHLRHKPSSFVGCMQDVVINGQWVFPHETNENQSLTNVERGCPREDQCNPNPCHSNGHCIDEWHEFSCVCERPHLGQRCQFNITAATFGHENASLSTAVVNVTESARRIVRSVFDISMFIKTRQPTGQVFYMGSDPDRSNESSQSFVSAKLNSGELLVRIQLNGTTEEQPVGGNRLDNGYMHLIQVVRNSTLVQVKINGTEYFRKTLSTIGLLDADVLYLGGPPPASSGINEVIDPLAYFKGIIQDVQVSNGSYAMTVELFPLRELDVPVPTALGEVRFDANTVLPGEVTDDLCRTMPCHQGECHNTWNDFTCVCPRGYKGKMCQDTQFCENYSCPSGAVCQNLDNGYECLSNTTFHGDESEPLEYVFNTSSGSERIVVDTVGGASDAGLLAAEAASTIAPTTVLRVTLEITYRTKVGGTMFYVKDGDYYFGVAVFENQVTVQWKLNDGLPVTRRFDQDSGAAAYGWEKIFLRLNNGKLEGGFRDWQNAIDPNPALSLDVDGAAVLQQLFGGGQPMYVGGIPHNESKDEDQLVASQGDRFKGCLGEIRVGGLVLPFFNHSEIYPEAFSIAHTYFPHFQLDGGLPAEEGCIVCFEKDCKNGAVCASPSEEYACKCVAGYEGDDCGHNIDECLQAECANNSTCIDLIAAYECRCQPGFEGRHCELEIDECKSQPCHNGGVCSDQLASYTCTCSDEYAGPQCDVLRQVTCENAPCRSGSSCTDGLNATTGNNFTCTCRPGFEGALCDLAFCQRRPCQNGGFCLHSEAVADVPQCQCSLGFAGRYCEEEVNECESQPCQNGGVCTDFVGSYKCSCVGTGFEGVNCETDIDECVVQRIRCGERGMCENTRGSFRCNCDNGRCGSSCDLADPCQSLTEVCLNGGICLESCTDVPDYRCNCTDGYAGKNCTEMINLVQLSDNMVPVTPGSWYWAPYAIWQSVFGSSEQTPNSTTSKPAERMVTPPEQDLYATIKAEGISPTDIAIIVVPIVVALLAIAGIALTVFLMMARNKRATRGTYSPSAQEYCNPRLEMDNVLKPPPEERLI